MMVMAANVSYVLKKGKMLNQANKKYNFILNMNKYL